MDISEHIKSIQSALRTGSFPNEASVSQGVVMRILGALDWNIYDPQIVYPEYSAGSGRVDFALCDPPGRPVVFLEVKHVGQAEGADRQLFEYSFHEGVPLAILTDGQEWHFYLPAETGHYEERRVYKLDILERALTECARVFERYLTFEDVSSGKAIESARADYKNVARTREIERTLPKAWRRLLEESDSLLCELLAEKVESLCGYSPDLETVSSFLTKQPGIAAINPPSTSIQRPKKGDHKPPNPSSLNEPKRGRSTRRTSRKHEFRLFNEDHIANTAITVVEQVLNTLHSRDSSFFERYCARPVHGRKRRYVARSPMDLYPDRSDLADKFAINLDGNYWLGTNFANREKMKILRLACEVAGIEFGKDLIVQLD